MLATTLSEGKAGAFARVFINITSKGCGSGCSYCYVEEFRGGQVLLSVDELLAGVNQILSDPRFVCGREGTIVSFCPDTEPFKTAASAELLLIAVRAVAPLGNRMQIATKELVPSEALHVCAGLQQYFGQFVLFVSLTTFRKLTIEPFAAPPTTRLLNFQKARLHGIASCLYIKPFISTTSLEVSLFARSIMEMRPDSICVGVLYQSTMKTDSAGHHPAHPDLVTRGLTTALKRFCADLRKHCDAPVFLTSVCASAALSKSVPRPDIRRTIRTLCSDCGNQACLGPIA